VARAKNVDAFRRLLLHWYARRGRDLPWRHTPDPYAILVSEFMLQQTQVATVRSYYNDWLTRFPDFAALARASENDILHAWQGLGYYARARNLHATAKLVQARHGGRFPDDVAAMRALPGIGKYTAHAVATFAFRKAVPIVEANTARVLARLFNLRTPIDSARGRQLLWQHSADLVPNRRATDFNSALVDLGALVCLPRKPRCPSCPVQRFCRATTPESLPIRRTRPETRGLIENHALVLQNNRILLEKTANRWRGMWILPPVKLDRLSRSSFCKPVYNSVFPFTHHRVTLRVFRQRAHKCKNQMQRWCALGELESIPIPSPHRRAIVDLLSQARAKRSRLTKSCSALGQNTG
jgi:A/G-specific adenine glycosylase